MSNSDLRVQSAQANIILVSLGQTVWRAHQMQHQNIDKIHQSQHTYPSWINHRLIHYELIQQKVKNSVLVAGHLLQRKRMKCTQDKASANNVALP